MQTDWIRTMCFIVPYSIAQRFISVSDNYWFGGAELSYILAKVIGLKGGLGR